MSNDKASIFDSLHSALLSRLIYKIFKKVPYNEKETFIDNIENIPSLKTGKTFKLLEEYFPDDKFIEFISCPDTGLQALITINKTEKKIYVTFRGTEPTEDIKDIIVNLIMCPKYISNDVYVHKGYWGQLTYNNFHVSMSNKVQKLINEFNDYKVIVSGHSLGSILGLFFSYYLMINRPLLIPKLSVFMFGSPRACNKELFYKMKKNNIEIYSFLYKNDIVQLLFPFYYYSYPRHILSDDWCYLLTNACDTSINKYKSSFGNNWIKDHGMANYVNSLCNIYKETNK
jgi:hypothetical protein